MREIERKFLLRKSAVQIEREAVEQGTLQSRRLIQQRYIAPDGWRLRAKAVPGPAGTVIRTLILKRNSGKKLYFTISEEAFGHLMQVADPNRLKGNDPAGTVRLRIDDLTDWTIRLRRSTSIAGVQAKCFLTLKRKITMVSCDEIESLILPLEHDAAITSCGPAIRKKRICVRANGRIWEIDIFLNPEFSGLELVEVELPSECAAIRLPDFAGTEISHDRSYKNAKLVRRLAA